MAVIIENMEMPSSCDDCPFQIYHSHIGGERNYVCKATPLFYPMNLANYKGGRKDFCPLKEVSSDEYKRGWVDAITQALKEITNYYTEDGVFKAIQEVLSEEQTGEVKDG